MAGTTKALQPSQTGSAAWEPRPLALEAARGRRPGPAARRALLHHFPVYPHCMKYNHDFAGAAGSLVPLSTFTSDGSDDTATFTGLLTADFKEYLFLCNNIVVKIKMFANKKPKS